MEIDAFLADSVMKADGKLFVLGAGWDQLSARSFPARHARLSLGVIITVPYLETEQQHELTVRFEDADGNALAFAGSQPAPGQSDKRPRQINARFTTGRPDDRAAGDERSVALAINLDGLVFDAPGRYRFLLDLDGAPQKRLAFRVSDVGS